MDANPSVPFCKPALRVLSKLSPILAARRHPQSAGSGTLTHVVCGFGTLMIIMEPGVDARPLLFLPLFTQVLRVVAGLTISFSERQHAT